MLLLVQPFYERAPTTPPPTEATQPTSDVAEIPVDAGPKPRAESKPRAKAKVL